jgi:hypothetical protein
MQGTYRVLGDGGERTETFVAAPGPAGWRYFGHVFEQGSDEEVFTLDFVVDSIWDVVRYRERHADGRELVVVPSSDGVQVARGLPGEIVEARVDGAEVVWSRSPCSLLVAERKARVTGTTELRGVRVEMPGEPRPVTISFALGESVSPGTAAGAEGAEELEVTVDGQRTRAMLRQDLPVFAEGWFELVG